MKNRFPVMPIFDIGPKDGQISFFWSEGKMTIQASFTATKEHEIDAMVTALLHVRPLLRQNNREVPREFSLVVANGNAAA
jgi:hypothetical protein